MHDMPQGTEAVHLQLCDASAPGLHGLQMRGKQLVLVKIIYHIYISTIYVFIGKMTNSK